MSLIHYALVFLISVGLSYALTPLSIRVGRRMGLVAVPGGRRTHQGEVVRIGGLGLYPAFLCATLVTLGIERQDPLELTRLIGVLVGMGVVWVVGLVDDRYSLPATAQIGGLALAAAVAIACSVFVEMFNSPFHEEQIKVDWYIMVPITLAWLVGMSGTMNVVDGLDGLATGITAIAALILFLHMLRLEQYSVSLLPLALMGCCLGFLPYNYAPARIFLGGGAHMLGFGLGALSIIAGAKVASALLVLWVPIMDVVWQIYARRRRGQSVGLGDRGHLHFRLQDLGWGTRKIVWLYWGVTLALGAVALLVSSRMLKLVVLLGGAVGMAVVLATLTHISGDETTSGR